MDRVKTHQHQVLLITGDIPYLNFTESNPYRTKHGEKYSYDLGVICNTLFWIHQRGVVCGSIEPEDIKDNVLYFHGAYLDIGVIKKYKQYFLGEESSQLFDLFSLGILGLLQHIATTKGNIEANEFGRKHMRNADLFLSLYKDDEFDIFPKLDKFWRSCLNKNPLSRPSSFSYSLVRKTLQFPVRITGERIVRSNNVILESLSRYRFCDITYKIVMTFDLMRKMGCRERNVLEREVQGEVYQLVESFATKSSAQTNYPVLNCDTLQLYYLVDSSSIFYDAIVHLSSSQELSSISDNYITEYLHNYADYKCVN